MEKSYTGRYPELKDNKFDFKRACIAMLNCRRYLESEKFIEMIGDFNDCNNYRFSFSSKIILPDRTIIGREDFYIDTKETDSLIEKIIKKSDDGPIKIIKKCDYFLKTDFVNKPSGFKGICYLVQLIIRPKDFFFINPNKFGMEHKIHLKKTLITDSDIADFEKYKQGLENAVKQDSLVDYSSAGVSIPNKDSIKVPEIKPLNTTEIPNPWDIEIDEIEDVRYSGLNDYRRGN